MNFLKKSLLSVAAVAAMSVAATAQAGVVVDLFTDPTEGQTVDTNTTAGGGNPLSATTVFPSTSQTGPFATTSVLGGYRDLSITRISGLNNTRHAKASIFEGQLSISNDDTVKSKTVVTWDGPNVAGLDGTSVQTNGLNVDLTLGGAANQIIANVFTADLGFDYKITVWDMDGSKATLAAGVQFPINDLGISVLSHYDFSWFNLANGTYCDGVSAPPACANPLTQLDFTITRGGNLGAIDFTKIGALQLELSNGRQISVDLSLGSIQTVPEPGALALVGLGLLGAVAASRRRPS